MYYKTRAFILKLYQDKQTRTYINAYTYRFGKVTFLARGLNKNEAKLKAALSPFVYSRLILVKTKGMPVVTRAELLKNYYPQSLQGKKLAYYFSDLVNRLVEEYLTDKHVLRLLLKSFAALNSPSFNKKTMMLLLTYFPLKLMQYLGYFPRLAPFCCHCSSKITLNKVYLSYRFNGLVCQKCALKDKKAIMLSQRELYFLKTIRQKNFSALKKIPLSLVSLEKLSFFANHYAFSFLGQIPSSFAFLRLSSISSTKKCLH